MYGLDLFSGIGGLTRALSGYVDPVAYCEIERYARAVLLSRMASGQLPPAPIWDDVTLLHGAMLPHIDIIYGGFPCQDISVAGRGGGLDGKRSGLFFEVARLVGEIKPAFVFLENVPAIRTRGLGRVIKTLADLGYDCRWCALSAADVGANHKRERWFLLAHAAGKQDRRIQLDGLSTNFGTGRKVADTDDAGQWIALPGGAPQNGSARTSEGSGWWDIEPSVGRVANGIPKRVDRLRALGNAVVPAQAGEAFERLMGLKEAAQCHS